MKNSQIVTEICTLVTVSAYKSRKVAMKSSEQFSTSRPCNTIILAARKMDPLTIVKLEL